jgi:hypothetical protein
MPECNLCLGPVNLPETIRAFEAPVAFLPLLILLQLAVVSLFVHQNTASPVVLKVKLNN